MDFLVGQLNSSTVLCCVLIGTLLLHWIVPWLRAVMYHRNIPGFEVNAVLLYYSVLYYVYRNKFMPYTTYVLEYVAGTCAIFSKQRIVSIWIMFRPVILLFKPETVEAVLNNSITIQKANEYSFLHPWLGTGLLTSNGDKWKNRRKLLTPAFHFRILETFQPTFSEQSIILVNRLKKVSHKEWVDIVPLITMCTLDIICQSAMGVKINAQDDPESDYVRAIYEIGDEFIYRVSRPWLWVNSIYFIFPSGRKFKRNLEIVHGFTRKVIKEKKKALLKRIEDSPLEKVPEFGNEEITQKKKMAFLELLLEHHIKDATLTEEDIREEVDTFMFEGHDTTAMAICWTLYNTGLRPDIQEKVLNEIDDIFGDDKQRPITTDDLKALKYLECVLKESLRLYPSVPLIGREVTQNINIGGYTIAPGTVCAIFPIILHRDPEIYPNPEVFDPDRFLPENCIGRHSYAYIPFSAGPRNCIGQRFAIMEEKTILANIFRNFKVKSLDPRDKIVLLPDLILRCEGPLRMQLIAQ